MKTAEHFALDEWLSEYPDGLTYIEILARLRSSKRVKHIQVWEVVEDYSLDQVANFIEDTKSHFERVTE